MAERKDSVQAAAPAPAQWQYVPLRTAAQKAKGYAGGEMGQMAFTLAISPSDPDCLAMGIDTAAVYTSTDGSKSWQLRRRGIAGAARPGAFPVRRIAASTGRTSPAISVRT